MYVWRMFRRGQPFLAREDRPLFGALVAIALALLLGFATAKGTGQPTDQQAQNHTNSAAVNQSPPSESFWQWTTHDAVAFYTFVLSLFTGALVLVSAVQIWFLIRADKTARISADAAKASADVIPQLERPHLYIEKLKVFYSVAIPGYEPRPPASPPRVTFTIRNYGRTPANIGEATFRIRLLDHVPTEIEDTITEAEKMEMHSTIEKVIAAGEPWEQTLICENNLGPKEHAWMKSGHGLYFWGRIVYRTIFGETHTTYFCRRFNLDLGMFEPVGGMDRNYGD